MVALCVNDLFEEITQQAEDILKSNLAFNTKLDQALDLCQEKMSQQISDYGERFRFLKSPNESDNRKKTGYL